MNALTPPDTSAKDVSPADEEKRKLIAWCSKLVGDQMAGARKLLQNGRERIAYTRGERIALRSALTVVLARHELLAERVAELEARPTLDSIGPYEHGRAYPKGSPVQHKGHLWIAMRDTSLAPSGNRDWRLAVRSAGRD